MLRPSCLPAMFHRGDAEREVDEIARPMAEDFIAELPKIEEHFALPPETLRDTFVSFAAFTMYAVASRRGASAADARAVESRMRHHLREHVRVAAGAAVEREAHR